MGILFQAHPVLPETFPGIGFNQHGICQYCQGFKGVDHLKEQKEQYQAKFQSLLSRHKSSASNYDVLVAYSGGKDSTQTLITLKEDYGLSTLALSLDNGFLSSQAVKNIQTVVETLGVDHIFLKPRFDLLSKIFRHCASNDIYPRKANERASVICTSCMGIVKYSALRIALEKDIPFVGYGWSPGQAPITSPIWIKK